MAIALVISFAENLTALYIETKQHLKSLVYKNALAFVGKQKEVFIAATEKAKMGTFPLTKKEAPKIFFHVSLKLNERKLSKRTDTHDDFITFPLKVIFFK